MAVAELWLSIDFDALLELSLLDDTFISHFVQNVIL